MNVKTGEILTMVSLPTYDDNVFTQGASARDLQRLYEDVHRPMMNHAIADRLPPGSVFSIPYLIRLLVAAHAHNA